MLAAARFGGGLAAFRTERRFTLAGLDSGGGDMPRNRIEAARRSADAMTMAGPSLLAMLPAGDEARRFEQILQDLPRWRATADRLLALPAAQRDAGAMRGYAIDTGRGIEVAADAWLKLLPQAAGQDASLMQRAEILATAWRLLARGGELRGSLASALLAGQVPDANALAGMNEARGGAKALLAILDAHARSGSLREEGIRAINEARTNFLSDGGFEGLARQAVTAWSAGRMPGFDAAGWLEGSTRSLERVAAAMASTEAGILHSTGKRLAEAQRDMWVEVSLAIAGLAFSGFLIWLIHARLTLPLDALSNAVRRIGNGESGVEVPGITRSDELGVLGRAMADLQRQQIDAALMRVAADQQRAAARAAQDAALSDMANTFETQTRESFAAIGERIGSVTAETQGIAAGAERISAAGQGAAQAASHALEASETVAAAAEEMAASIREISSRMNEAANLTQTAVEGTRSGTSTVRGLSEAVQRIGKVAEMISDIAARTNLLALNATIEAARAGEAGKGFAVVASEVKSLAAQTARATQEIGQQIAEVQAETARAVEAISRIGQTVEGLEQIAAGVAAAMVQQSSATQEIARAVASSAEAAREVSGRVDSLGQEASEAADRAERMRESTQSASTALEEVRGTLVRTVRECSEAVERRKAPRFPISLSARLEYQGRTHHVSLLDLSEGGASIEAMPGLTRGAAVTLHLAGMAGGLSGQVVDASEKRAGIAFSLSPSQKQDLQSLLAVTLKAA